MLVMTRMTTKMMTMIMIDRYKYEHGGSGEEDKSGGETRREKEGAVYCRRDKIGSASEWFTHDHASDAQKQQRSGKAVTCGSANAARMRSESDCWYNYDKSGAAEEPNVHKKRAAAVKPGTNEMHGVFHHATADN